MAVSGAALSEPAGPWFEGEVSELERRRWLNVLANLPSFDRAASETVESLLRAATFRHHAPKDRIYCEGQVASAAYFLIEGVVRVFQIGRSSQVEYTPKIFRAPTHFGDLAGLARLGVYRSSIEAITSCVTASVPLSTLERALAGDHALCLAWLRSIARQRSVTVDGERQHVFGGLPARFANVLLSYSDVFGVGEGAMRAIDHPLSYNTLARLAGSTRRAAIETMHRLSEAGSVARSGDTWRIDPEKLRKDLAPGRLSLAYSLEPVSSYDD